VQSSTRPMGSRTVVGGTTTAGTAAGARVPAPATSVRTGAGTEQMTGVRTGAGTEVHGGRDGGRS
jgi:hypothetical protein